MAGSEEGKLSTTALAHKLHISVQQLFTTLRDYGWLQRAGDSWVLTKKGEYEGGSYRNSKKYGTYIVWPEHLEQHSLLAAISSEHRLDAEMLCRSLSAISPRYVNRMLGELGLQRRSELGWELTAKGKLLGGRQEICMKSDALYVSWPHSVLDNPVLAREFSRLRGEESNGQETPEVDLFSEGTNPANAVACIDGHPLSDPLRVSVCNWLYFAQVPHACHRALPLEEELYADFYLPSISLHIDCWHEILSAAEVATRLRKRAVYEAHELQFLELHEADLGRLDDILEERLGNFRFIHA